MVGNIRFKERTYFELSDGGLYRVDDKGRTWKLDPDNGSEILYWDLRPIAGPVPKEAPTISDPPTNEEFYNLLDWLWSNGYLPLLELDVPEYKIGTVEMIANGKPIIDAVLNVEKIGPFDVTELNRASGHLFGPWTSVAGRNEEIWQKLLSKWNATKVEGLRFVGDPDRLLIVSPEVGTIYQSESHGDGEGFCIC